MCPDYLKLPLIPKYFPKVQVPDILFIFERNIKSEGIAEIAVNFQRQVYNEWVAQCVEHCSIDWHLLAVHSSSREISATCSNEQREFHLLVPLDK